MPRPPASDFSALYRATIGPLRRYLARMLRNTPDAQDIAHDAYTKMYEAMDLQKIDQPEAFLYTTARRLALNQIRRNKIAPAQPSTSDNIVEFAPDPGPSVESVVMARQEWSRMSAAIALLPSGCRSVLLLRKMEGLSHAEIGQRLGISISTVEKQHARALRLLKDHLNGASDQKTINAKDSGFAAGA